MSDEEIEKLDSLLKSNSNIYWQLDHISYRCIKVLYNWREVYPGGHLAETTEPAVQLEDNKFAALYNAESSQFVKLEQVFNE